MQITLQDIPTEGHLQLFASEFSRSTKRAPKERPKWEKYVAPAVLVFIVVYGSWSHYIVINWIIDPWLDVRSGLGIIALACILFFSINSIIALICAMFADPGPIAEGWKLWKGEQWNHPPLPEYAKMNKIWLSKLAKQLSTTKSIMTVDHSNPEESSNYFKSQAASGNTGIMLLSTADMRKEIEGQNWIHVPVENQKKPKKRMPQSQEEFEKAFAGMAFPMGIVPNLEHIITPYGSIDRKKKKKQTTFKPREDYMIDVEEYKQPVPKNWCDTCLTYKPPRSHHCTRCKRCVAKMDHHCIFLGKCVGYGNFKYFYLFLFHTTFGLSFGWLMIFSYAICGEVSMFTSQGAILFFLEVSAGALIRVIGNMLLYHTKMLRANTTQMEEIFDEKSVHGRFSKGSSFLNGKLILGSFPITWLFPI